MSRRRHTPKLQWFLAVVPITFLLLNSGLGLNASRAENLPDAEESHPGLARESRYAEAVIAYNRKQTQKALEILDELTAESPKTIEYLELKALILKGLHEPKKSLEVYRQLYQASPEKSRGPYAFELGTLYDKEGKPELAEAYFQKAIVLGFNVAASNLYIGLIRFRAGDFAQAERRFYAVANSDIPDLEIVGRYYLGIVYFKMNNGAQGVQELVDVQRLARDRGNDDLTRSLSEATGKMLSPFSKGQWFGNLALLTQYDSNVQQLPSGITNPTGGSNPSTMKLNFTGGGGYMTAPLDPIQWVAAYRATLNYNLNASTRAYQYLTNTATLFMNYRTLARTSGGLKLEGNYTFQDTPEDASNLTSTSYTYLKYDSTIGIGPYFRHQLNRMWRLEGEATARKQTFYIDPNLSGNVYNARVSARNDSGRRFWNPGASLMYEIDAADSSQYYYKAYGVGVTNTMSLSGSITITQAIDFLSSNYTQSNPKRDDKNYSFKVSFSRIMNPRWALLADITYLKNDSTIPDSYSYTRFLTSLGVGYTF